jgi:hypothetical protein
MITLLTRCKAYHVNTGVAGLTTDIVEHFLVGVCLTKVIVQSSWSAYIM